MIKLIPISSIWANLVSPLFSSTSFMWVPHWLLPWGCLSVWGVHTNSRLFFAFFNFLKMVYSDWSTPSKTNSTKHRVHESAKKSKGQFHDPHNHLVLNYIEVCYQNNSFSWLMRPTRTLDVDPPNKRRALEYQSTKLYYWMYTASHLHYLVMSLSFLPTFL